MTTFLHQNPTIILVVDTFLKCHWGSIFHLQGKKLKNEKRNIQITSTVNFNVIYFYSHCSFFLTSHLHVVICRTSREKSRTLWSRMRSTICLFLSLIQSVRCQRYGYMKLKRVWMKSSFYLTTKKGLRTNHLIYLILAGLLLRTHDAFTINAFCMKSELALSSIGSLT